MKESNKEEIMPKTDSSSSNKTKQNKVGFDLTDEPQPTTGTIRQKKPTRLSMLNSSILGSFDLSNLLSNNNNKMKQKNKLVVASPLDRQPQCTKIEEEDDDDDNHVAEYDLPPSLLSDQRQNPSNKSNHSETTGTSLSTKPPLTTAGSSNNTQFFNEDIVSRKNQLRTEASVFGMNIKQYDQRAEEIFPSVFNLICGSFDALISDNPVLEENNSGKKMGEFTSTFLEILYDAHENGKMDGYGEEEGMSWELLMKYLREKLLKDGKCVCV